MNKKFLAITITLFAIFGLFSAGEVLANNVSGWAWSNMERPAGHPGGAHDPTIGWISFNCNNPELPTPRCTVNYGVHIDPATGNFSGHAWSTNIGWIHFAPAGPYPAAPHHSARVDLATGIVSGWARALAHDGGWGGWIRLRGTTTGGTSYGVSISTTTGAFSGWAWSNMVIGWISFSGANYGVITTPGLFNAPPSVINLSVTTGTYCGAASPPIFLNWVFSDPNPGDTQLAYQVQVATNTAFAPIKIDTGKVTGLAGTSQSYAPPGLSFNTTYHWRVRVWDNQNPALVSAWSVGPSFTTHLHRYPVPNFIWSPPSPTANESIQFTDTSVCYGINNITVPCNTWAWDFGDGTTLSNIQHPTHSYAQNITHTVTLSVTDGSGFTCSISRPLTVELPLPWYREVSPIIWLRKLLARVVDFYF